ncbi:MAG: alpha/beta hydrolase fold domain-containing protein [Bacteroidales bacterium]|nr:alpha/beta hydrolase fold domain-containing protein [Bacteroidales bacterium]
MVPWWGLTKGIAKTPAELLTEDYVVASVSYRLYPDVSVKEIIDDAALAVAWVVKNAKQYSGSLDKIYLSGHSAGGYLVSMISLDKSYLARYGVDANMIAGVIPLSGQMITHFTERKARGMERTKIVVDEMAPL